MSDAFFGFRKAEIILCFHCSLKKILLGGCLGVFCLWRVNRNHPVVVVNQRMTGRKADDTMQDQLMEAFLLSVQPLSRSSGPPPEPVMIQNQPIPFPSSAPAGHRQNNRRDGMSKPRRHAVFGYLSHPRTAGAHILHSSARCGPPAVQGRPRLLLLGPGPARWGIRGQVRVLLLCPHAVRREQVPVQSIIIVAIDRAAPLQA